MSGRSDSSKKWRLNGDGVKNGQYGDEDNHEAVDDTLRTLSEMLQQGRIPPELLSDTGQRDIISSVFRAHNVSRITYSTFPTALSEFSRVDINRPDEAWFSRPKLDAILTIPLLEDPHGKPLCGVFVRHLRHIGAPDGPRTLMKLEVPEESVIFTDRILGFSGRSCRHRTVEIDICNPDRVETDWAFDGYCLNYANETWKRPSHLEHCHWEMTNQGHKPCLSGIEQTSPYGDWQATTNCDQLQVNQGQLPLNTSTSQTAGKPSGSYCGVSAYRVIGGLVG